MTEQGDPSTGTTFHALVSQSIEPGTVMKSKAELPAIRRRAVGYASVNLALGIGAMIYSLGEQSVGWTFFVWLAGLEGISIGLLGGVGYSQAVLDLIPPKWKMPPIAGFFWAILTYWAPILVTFLFGTMLYTTLPDAALPKSKLQGNTNMAGLMQSLVTFFNANGCIWLMVLIVTRKVEQSYPESEDGTDATFTQ